MALKKTPIDLMNCSLVIKNEHGRRICDSDLTQLSSSVPSTNRAVQLRNNKEDYPDLSSKLKPSTPLNVHL